MKDYLDQITIKDIVFRRQEQNESHLWDYRYQSNPLRVIGDYPLTIRLYVGTRLYSTLGWTARLHIGPWQIWVDAAEYYEAEDALERCLKELEREETFQKARAYIAYHTKES